MSKFWIEAAYESFDDEPDLTSRDLADRLRGFGFTCVDVIAVPDRLYADR